MCERMGRWLEEKVQEKEWQGQCSPQRPQHSVLIAIYVNGSDKPVVTHFEYGRHGDCWCDSDPCPEV